MAPKWKNFLIAKKKKDVQIIDEAKSLERKFYADHWRIWPENEHKTTNQ